jgi:DnaK suppressor protein
MPNKPKKAGSPAGGHNAPEDRSEALRRILNNKRRELLKETQDEISKYVKGENRQLVESALDDGDWSVIDVAEDINLRKLGVNRETLQKIDISLRKLDNGSYGVCDDCGEEISRERLRVMPFAIRCRDCQEDFEEQQAAAAEENQYG